MSVRRRRPAGPPVPERYAEFVRSQWPAGLAAEEAIEFWHLARSAWAVENEYEWPPGSGYRTSPIGDWLDRMRAKREAWLLTCTKRDPEESNGHGSR
jgi:hypothetical protein